MKKLTIKKLTIVTLVLALLMMAAVPALSSAERSGRLALYTSVPTNQLNMITAMFSAKYPGVKIDVISAGSKELTDRLLSAKGHEKGGVILGGGLDVFEALAGSLSAYESPNASAFQAIFKAGSAAYTPVQIHVSAFVVNTALAGKLGVSVDGWASLLDEKLNGLVLFTDPGASTADAQQAAFVSAVADKLALAKPSAPSFVLNSVTAGQSLVGIINEEKALERVSRNPGLSLVYASEGVAMGASYAGILEGTKDEASARLFIDFITSQEYQQAAADRFHQRSVRTDVSLGVAGIPSTAKLVMANYQALTVKLLSSVSASAVN